MLGPVSIAACCRLVIVLPLDVTRFDSFGQQSWDNLRTPSSVKDTNISLMYYVLLSCADYLFVSGLYL